MKDGLLGKLEGEEELLLVIVVGSRSRAWTVVLDLERETRGLVRLRLRLRLAKGGMVVSRESGFWVGVGRKRPIGVSGWFGFRLYVLVVL